MLQPSNIIDILCHIKRPVAAIFICLSILCATLPASAAVDAQDSQLFIAGFNAYHKADYSDAADKMNQVLTKYPDTPLRDMVLFWISRSHFKLGNNREAARYFSQFSKEYPESPLLGTAEEELSALAKRHDSGEQLSNAAQIAKVDTASPKAAPDSPSLQTTTTAQTPPAPSVQSIRDATAEQAAEAKRAQAIRDAEHQARVLREAEQQAAMKAAAEKKALEEASQAKAETLRLTAEKAALEKAASERAAAEQAALERLAALQASEQSLAGKLAEEKAAREKIEAELATERSARTRAEAELISRKQLEKTASEKAASEKAALERLAAVRASEQSLAEKLAAEQAAREKINVELAAERSARARAETELTSREQLEKTASDRAASEKAALERLAAVQASEQSLAAKLATEQAAREKIEAELATERSARTRAETEMTSREQLEKTVSEKAASEKAALERLAAVRASEQSLAEKLAAEQAASEKIKAELAAERSARARAETELASREQRAIQQLAAANKALAAARPETATRSDAKKGRSGKVRRATDAAALREKAITEYKRIITSFPGTPAAASAQAKLRELGIGGGVAVASTPPAMTSTARVLAFEVGQYAGVELTRKGDPVAAAVGRRVSVPFELTNTGNGPDSFDLSTEAPADLAVTFTPGETQAPITVTPPLAPGEKFSGRVEFAAPVRAIDGERLTFTILARSRFTADISQSREIRSTASAPLLRAVIKSDRTVLLPGEKVAYTVSLLNVGSAPADDLAFTLTVPAQLIPQEINPSLTKDSSNNLHLERLSLKSGENRELKLSFILSDEALAGQELFVQGEFKNNALQRSDSFMAQSLAVAARHGVRAATANPSLTIISGQQPVIPITVRNEGNIREDFSIATAVPAPTGYTIFLDQNRDGLKQASEPVVNHVGPLAPRETAHILLELQPPKNAENGTAIPVSVSLMSDSGSAVSSRVDVTVTIVRPIVELQLNGKGGKLRPGEVATFEMDCVNRGSSLAKTVLLESVLPEQLELVASDPLFSRGENGRYQWSFQELGSGEKRNIKVTYRIKAGTALGTSLQLQNLISYQDLNGNRY